MKKSLCFLYAAIELIFLRIPQSNPFSSNVHPGTLRDSIVFESKRIFHGTYFQSRNCKLKKGIKETAPAIHSQSI